MSYKLVEEVYEHAPPELTLGDRAVLVLLAHHADEQSRECWPGMPKITRRTGMHAESVRRAVNHLVELGIVSRVGAPAMRNRSTVYRLHHAADWPNGAQAQSATAPTEGRANPETRLPLPSTGDSPNRGQGPEGQEPSEPSNARASSTSPVDGWTPDEAKAHIRNNFTRRSA